jgi:glucokinase
MESNIRKTGSMESNILLGIDIGGTSAKCLLWDPAAGRFSSLNKRLMVRCATAGEEVQKNVTDLILETLLINGYSETSISGIGLSSAALFDRQTGQIVNWPNNPLWNGFPIRQCLEERFDTCVVMEDDANACTIAESVYGAGKGSPNMIYITVSSGIGCGIILNGSLYTGVNGWAGELGHIRLLQGDTVCVCGRKGCLQSMASGRALYKKAVGINQEQAVPALLQDMEDVVRLAREGVPWAVCLFDEAGSYVAQAIECLVMLLDIDTFVVGGGVTKAGDLFMQPLRDHLQQLLQVSGRTVRVENSLLEDAGCAMGAMYLLSNFVSAGQGSTY